MQNYNEVVITECVIYYRLNDELHRIDGPAAIYYNTDGSINIVIYWLYGKTLSKDEFLEQQQNFAGKLK